MGCTGLCRALPIFAGLNRFERGFFLGGGVNWRTWCEKEGRSASAVDGASPSFIPEIAAGVEGDGRPLKNKAKKEMMKVQEQREKRRKERKAGRKELKN